MAKFNDFIGKLNKSAKPDQVKAAAEQSMGAGDLKWMAKPLNFHVDSEKAYNVQKAKEYEESVGTGKNFEQYATKGDASKSVDFQRYQKWYQDNKHS